MKGLLILISFWLAGLFLSPQQAANAQTAPTKAWNRTLGGSINDFGRSVVRTSDGGYLVGGMSTSPISGDKSQHSNSTREDIWLIKLDTNGSKIWDKTYYAEGDDYLTVIRPTPDGGFILGGTSDSNVSGIKSEPNRGFTGVIGTVLDYWIIKIDSLGNKVWDKTYGAMGQDELFDLQVTSDGGFIIGGESYFGIGGDRTHVSRGGPDYWVVKMDSIGNKQWDKAFGGNDYDHLRSIQQTPDGGYILGGFSHSDSTGDRSVPNKGVSDYWVVKIDSNGNKQWDKAYGGLSGEFLYSILPTSDGGYLLSGNSASGISGDKTQLSKGAGDYWVIKIDSIGTKIWDKSFGSSAYESFGQIIPTADGGYVLAGASLSGIGGDKSEPSRGLRDFWLVKVDGNFNKVWDKTLGGDRDDVLYSIQEDSDKGLVLAGETRSNNTGDKSQPNKGPFNSVDYWVVKLNPACSNLSVTFSPTCNSSTITVRISITGLQSNTTGILPWTLTYLVNGVSQTATGTSSTFILQQNAPIGTVYSLVSIVSGTCTTNLTNSLTVQAVPGAPAVTPGNKCGPGSVTLSASGAPVGGSYYWYDTPIGGTALNNGTTGVFNTPSLSATTTYYVAAANNAGCEGPRVPVVATISPLPVVNAGLNVTICEIAAAVQLTGFSPSGGTWSGPQVSAAGLFTPSNNMIGDQALIYSVTQNGCTNSDTLLITVTAAPVLTAGLNDTVCADASPFQLTGFSPAGGTWLGSGVSATGLFAPSTSLVGNLTLTYSYTQNGCTITSTKMVVVKALPNVVAGQAQTICEDSAPVQLTGFSPAGGTWSGAGVSATGLFTPSSSLIGNQTLTYTVTQNGCTASATKVITIPTPLTQPVISLHSSDTLIASTPGSSYEWKHNNNVIPGNKQKLRVSASGTYSVRVKDANNCASLFSTDYTYTVSGLKEEQQNSFSLYPNPSSGLIHLELNDNNDAYVSIYNALGQRVFTKNVVKTAKKDIQIDLSKEAKGVYTIQVLSGTQIVTKKVVLQ